ncbi:hypothetical protein [Hyphomicrobium sp. 1Nfss2.1]|uniref:hypothetical protein n=1 Tax=Hyphomicrobium sp. 1Nfss2.1 TaxID=3413936 RepID=UPI003C7B3CA9
MPPNISMPMSKIVNDGEDDCGLSLNSRKNFPIFPSRLAFVGTLRLWQAQAFCDLRQITPLLQRS